jgi:hypothetical protein
MIKKQLLLGLIVAGSIIGNGLIAQEEVTKPNNFKVKIGATARTIVDVLSYPLVAYPAYKFTFDQLSKVAILGKGGISWGSGVAIGLLAGMTARELYLYMHEALGCSNEYIEAMCRESDKQESHVINWVILGVLLYGLGS